MSLNHKSNFERALALHRCGALDSAMQIYRTVLQIEPAHFGAAHMLGVVLLQQGHFDPAERQLRRASQIGPQSADILNHLGLALHQLERLDEALEAYDRAIALRPTYADAFCNRGNALFLMERGEDALASYDRAIALRPAYADAFYNRGALLAAVDRFDDAIASYETAVAIQPHFPQALNSLGNALQAICRYDEALAVYDRALAQAPAWADALTNRGIALHHLHRYDEALDSHERALALKPDSAEALNSRAGTLRDMSRFGDAQRDYIQALALNPNHFEARWNLGLTQLLLGDWALGWPNYELRFRKRRNASARTGHPAPEWTGENLAGRSILLYGEQGFGDALQFIRFAPLLQAQGATVTVLTNRRLHRILASAGAELAFVEATPLHKHFDFQIALMSIPGVLGLRPDTVHAAVAYLAPDPRRAEIWRARLGVHGFKVGLAWQGNPAGFIDNGRSLPLRAFQPLAGIDRVRLISLQKNHGAEQFGGRPASMPVEAPGHEFDDGADAFIDTAAMMANLDLVVTSDTSIAHLAGALGRPVWIAIKHVPDWRWLLHREDSPWYPSARLFRQDAPGDWDGVVRQMEAAMREAVRGAAANGDMSSVA